MPRINKIKLITLDGDNTLFSYASPLHSFFSSWDALGYSCGLIDKWNRRTKKYFKFGQDDYDWARLDAKDLRGLPLSSAEEFLYPVPYIPGVLEFAERTKGRFIRGMLSSSVDLVADRAKEELDLEFGHYNQIHHKDGKFTGKHTHNVHLWHKHALIPMICRQYDVSPNEICHIGDGLNDVSTGQMVGMFVAMNPRRKEVIQAADHIVLDFNQLNRIFGL